MEPPELWWSTSYAELRDDPRAGVLTDENGRATSALPPFEGETLQDWPTDAVPLVPAEPLDEKGRGPAYWRGYADGRVEQRFDAPWPRNLIEQAKGYARSMHGQPYDPGPYDVRFSPPPFAPELADAPIVTGESGSPAPLVVDTPVHESTLPAELRGGRVRDFPSDRDTDEGTHYPGDGCDPPHPGLDEESRR